ncbi:MAG: hypothetical protein QGG50_03840 [Methanopyri archaeon]|jgi:hypothetical protein|nr:hypothetical protein [Methanopyri archaeon]
MRDLKLYIGRLDSGRVEGERLRKIERQLGEIGGQALVERFRQELRKVGG